MQWITLLTTIFVKSFGITNGLQLVSNLHSSGDLVILGNQTDAK